MPAKCTSTFRVSEEGATRKYTPGEVITRPRSVEIALENEWGVEISDAEAGLESAEKAKSKPKNKAKAAPKNKAAG